MQNFGMISDNHSYLPAASGGQLAGGKDGGFKQCKSVGRLAKTGRKWAHTGQAFW